MEQAGTSFESEVTEVFKGIMDRWDLTITRRNLAAREPYLVLSSDALAVIVSQEVGSPPRVEIGSVDRDGTITDRQEVELVSADSDASIMDGNVLSPAPGDTLRRLADLTKRRLVQLFPTQRDC